MKHIIQLIYGVSNMWEYVKGSEADFGRFSDNVLYVWRHKNQNHSPWKHGSPVKNGWETDSDYTLIAERRKVDNLQSRVNDASLQQAFDTVQRPAHYNQSGIECIDAIAASMTPEEFQAYLKGNVQKYLWRYQHKNGVEDCRKAQWYLGRLIKELSK